MPKHQMQLNLMLIKFKKRLKAKTEMMIKKQLPLLLSLIIHTIYQIIIIINLLSLTRLEEQSLLTQRDKLSKHQTQIVLIMHQVILQVLDPLSRKKIVQLIQVVFHLTHRLQLLIAVSKVGDGIIKLGILIQMINQSHNQKKDKRYLQKMH